MNAMRSLALVALVLGFLASPVAGQDSGRGVQKAERKSDRNKRRTDRKSGRRAKRAERSKRELELLALGPQAFREKEAAEMLEIARHMYQFEPAQSGPIEQQIAKIQDAWWRSSPEISELETLLTQRRDMFEKLSSELGEEEDPGARLKTILKDRDFSKLNSQIRRFERKNPRVFAEHLDQIEAVLDAETVDMARKKWARRSSRLRNKTAIPGLLRGLTSRRQMRKVRDKSTNVVAGDKPKAGDSGANKPARKPTLPRPADQQTAQEKRSRPAKPKPVKKPPSPPTREEPARPLNEWEKYVLDFIARYDLTPTQRNSAMSILRELTSRAVQLEKANRPRIEAAQKITDQKARRKRLAELNKPVDALFMALKQRLDRLLTASQRQKAGRK